MKFFSRALTFALVALVVFCCASCSFLFPESIVTDGNTIIMGDLDCELYHTNSKTQKETVEPSKSLFEEVVWDSGAFVWEEFTVKNEGDLAFKYLLDISIADSLTVDGVSFGSLLRCAVVDESFDYSKQSVDAIPEEDWVSIEELSVSGVLLPDEEAVCGIVIRWHPSEQDTLFTEISNTEKIDIDVCLYATQVTDEEDAFGDDYDSSIEYDE